MQQQRKRYLFLILLLLFSLPALGLLLPAVPKHSVLPGLDDDDHPQYIKDTEFTQNSGFLVGTASGTFQEETGATVRTSLGLGTLDDVEFAAITGTTYNGLGITTGASSVTFTLPTAGYFIFTDTAPAQWSITNAAVGGFLLGVSGTSAINQNVTTTGSPSFAAATITGDTITIATTKTPSGPSDTGTTGQMAWDSDYEYRCVATNTWKRAALSTWGIPAEDVVYAGENVIYAAEQVVYP